MKDETSLPAPPRARRRFVVIDDNPDAADTVALLLSEMGGDCRVAYDGPSGVRLARDFRPEVILLDVGLPGQSGYDTCREIRSALGTKVLVVALTGSGSDEDRENARRAGFDVHILKPAELDALQTLVDDGRLSSVGRGLGRPPLAPLPRFLT
jgi:two-component system, sensor histidine kinase